MAELSRRPFRSFPSVATSSCRATKPMKLSWTFYKGPERRFRQCASGSRVIDLSTVYPRPRGDSQDWVQSYGVEFSTVNYIGEHSCR